MPSKQRFEGYLMVDHRDSPGLTEEQSVAVGRPPNSGRGMFEAPTITCGHCLQVLIVNPLRNRARGYCPKCDSYCCDQCEAVRVVKFECNTFAKTMDDTLEAGGRLLSIDPVSIPLLLSPGV